MNIVIVTLAFAIAYDIDQISPPPSSFHPIESLDGRVIFWYTPSPVFPDDTGQPMLLVRNV